jgi:MSHA biogenesis protein MshM
MYLDHFGFSEPPFRITPHTDFFFSGANRGATLEALLYAITHDEGIVKVSGEVGSGKTMLCRVLMERLPENVETIYLANPSLRRDEILIAIADELKLDLGSERGMRVLRALQEALIRLYADGRRVVVLIDEAHAMPKETLEEIRLLSNLEAHRTKLLQVVLFGQPELDTQLNTAAMRQLKERITHSFRLDPLVSGDIASYIDFRLRAAAYRGPNPFNARALRMIAAASEGLTRRINILADKALLAAFAADSHAVTEREVRRAIDDSQFYQAPPKVARLAVLTAFAGLAAGVAIGWGLFQTMERLHPPGITTSASAPGQPPTATASPGASPAPKSAQPVTRPVLRASAVPAAPVSAARAEQKKALVQDPAAAKREGAVEGAGPLPPARGKLVQQRFLATQDWLERSPKHHYAIQLLTVRESEVGRLENFLRKATEQVGEADLYVYSVKIDGVQHYRAAYGSYADLSQLRAAMNELPALLKAQHPYHRSIERMRSQNRR